MLLLAIIFFVLLYLISSFFYWSYSKTLDRSRLSAARALHAFNLICHFGFIASWVKTTGVDQLGESFVRHLVFFIVGLTLWLLAFRRSRLLIVVLGIPLLCLGFVLNYFVTSEGAVPNLPSLWVWTHIMFMIFGEAVFFIAAIVSGIFLLAEWRLKHKKLDSIFAKIPSLGLFDEILGRLLPIGFALLTIGLFLGVLFSKQYWDFEWIFDPKVILTFMTWTVYACLIVLRWIFPDFSGKKTASLALIGFVAVVFLSWGSQFFFSSVHNWEPTHEEYSQ